MISHDSIALYCGWFCLASRLGSEIHDEEMPPSLPIEGIAVRNVTSQREGRTRGRMRRWRSNWSSVCWSVVARGDSAAEEGHLRDGAVRLSSSRLPSTKPEWTWILRPQCSQSTVEASRAHGLPTLLTVRPHWHRRRVLSTWQRSTLPSTCPCRSKKRPHTWQYRQLAGFGRGYPSRVQSPKSLALPQ